MIRSIALTFVFFSFSLLSHSAYNLFVLNPSSGWLTVPASLPPSTEITYGYRTGFSDDEFDTLLDSKPDASIATFLKDWPSRPEAKWNQQQDGIPEEIMQFKPRTKEEVQHATDNPIPKVQVLDHTHASEEWAESVLTAPHFTGPQPLAMYLLQQRDHHPSILRTSLNNPYGHEDCLVDNWIGRGRSIWIDLSAGPSKWGPISGGEGVRTNESFPNVRTFVSQWKAEHESENEKSGDGGTSGESFIDVAYDADAIEAEQLILEDLLRAHKCGTSEEDTSSKGECANLRDKLSDLSDWRASHSHELVGSSSLSPKPQTKPPPLDSLEGLSFFHEDQHHHEDGTTISSSSNGGSGHHDESIEVDHFLSHLSSTLSNALHHVFTPTVGDTHVTHGFAEQVNFHIYILVNHQQYDPLSSNFIERLKFGLEQLRLTTQTFTYTVHKLTMDDDPTLSMAYVTSLKTTVLPSILYDGRFTTIKRMYLDTSSLGEKLEKIDRSERSDEDINYRPQSSQSKPQPQPSPSFSPLKSRDISIFLFSLEYPLPVLVDKFYQSRPLPKQNMVISVQSNLHLWESTLTCNNRPMFWDLRDPIRSILASTAHILGGLLPLHETWSEPHRRKAQDWLWSVGMSPLAMTSANGLEFSQIQRDTLHRNYVLTAWERTTRQVNRQIALLKAEKTTHANRMLGGIDDDIPIQAGDAATDPRESTTEKSPSSHVGRFSERRLALQNAYIEYVDIISREMIPSLEEFHFENACRSIERLYHSANEFQRHVQELITWNRRDRCQTLIPGEAMVSGARLYASSSPFHLTFHWYLLTAILCAGILLYRIIRPRNDKPKLN